MKKDQKPKEYVEYVERILADLLEKKIIKSFRFRHLIQMKEQKRFSA